MSRVSWMLSLMFLAAATVMGGAVLIAVTGCEGEAHSPATAAHADVVTLDFDVKGMSCEGCVFAVRSAIVELDGVEACDVSLADERAVVTESDDHVEGRIIEAVEKLDFTITRRGEAGAAYVSEETETADG
jgi:copper chaperone CopZ